MPVSVFYSVKECVDALCYHDEYMFLVFVYLGVVESLIETVVVFFSIIFS